MLKPPRFLYVPQNKQTLQGPYIIHTRLPILILEMVKEESYVYSGHLNASFIILNPPAGIENKKLSMIEAAAEEWFNSQLSQKLLKP